MSGWRSTKPKQTESEIERKFVSLLKDAGALTYKFVSPGNPGVPDRIVILPGGKVLFVELKSEIGRTKKLQDYQLDRISKLGAPTYVLHGAAEVKQFVKEIFGGQGV